MNHVIEIHKKVNTRDALGGIATDSYVPWRRVFASVLDTGGSEGLRGDAGQRIGKVTTVFEIQNAPTRTSTSRRITPDMQIVYAGERYNVISALPHGKNKHRIVINAERIDT